MDSSNASTSASQTNVKRPDRVSPYRFLFWTDICGEDTTSELLNLVGMLLSMVGLLLKNKYCAWLGLLVAAMSYSNLRVQNQDFKQTLSQFCLAGSAVIMAYATNPQPLSVYFVSQHTAIDSAGLDVPSVKLAPIPDSQTVA